MRIFARASACGLVGHLLCGSPGWRLSLRRTCAGCVYVWDEPGRRSRAELCNSLAVAIKY